METTLSIGEIVSRNPQIVSGRAVFTSTRVPIETLIAYLEGGDTLDTFLDHFPTVRREQAVAALELLREVLLAE
ncbi:MAG: DUF433 domain-containing protein [Chloroflexia bacterium]|nr:DUF433 domain-containing protein [Chloroflexia bacterium]